MRTQDRTILISGGSRGLGLFLTQALLQGANRVATFARSRTEAVDQLEDTYRECFYFEELDAVDRAPVRSFVGEVSRRFGSIDALINNAAVGQDELLVHTPEDRIAEIVGINVTGPICLSRLVLKRMLLQPSRGCLVNITSICASRGYAGLAVYAATKGAMDAFTRSMARELADACIPVNSIAPGFFKSDMSSVLLPQQMEAILRRTPSGRLTTEADVLATVDLLVSREANINGQTITIDGGITI